MYVSERDIEREKPVCMYASEREILVCMYVHTLTLMRLHDFCNVLRLE